MISLADTEEIVVFGKGVGESILFRVKNDKWIVIDSFIAPGTDNPIVLEYMKKKSIDQQDIIGIICTHWDNDHVQGISKIIEQHKEPLTIVIPIVLRDNRVKKYVENSLGREETEISEFVNVLMQRKEKKCNLFWAQSDRILFGREIGDSNIEIIALSPNDEQYEEFLKSNLSSEYTSAKKGYSSYENSISIAVHAKLNETSLLLGGDLENSAIGGWGDICRNYHESMQSDVFKVPHHGSETAYCEEVWGKLVNKPISLITRFNSSHLPREDTLVKIVDRSSKTFVIGPKQKKDKKVIRLDKKSNGIIKEATILDDTFGYVRLYKEDSSCDWREEIKGSVICYK